MDPLPSPQVSSLEASDWGHWCHWISAVSLLPAAFLWVFRLTVRLVTMSLRDCFTADQCVLDCDPGMCVLYDLITVHLCVSVGPCAMSLYVCVSVNT